MARKYTNKVLEMMDEGLVDPKWLAEALAMWCSEADMKEFYERLPDELYAGSLENDDEE